MNKKISILLIAALLSGSVAMAAMDDTDYRDFQEQDLFAQAEPEMGYDEQNMAYAESAPEVEKKKKKKKFFSFFKKKKRENKETSGKKASRMERKRKKALEKESRRREKREMKRVKVETREHDFEMASKMVDKKERRKRENKVRERQENVKLASRWLEMRDAESRRDYELGKFADLYKSPAWDPFATYVTNTYLMNVGASYMYASDGYSNDGYNFDISKLAFGENTMYFKDFLLTSKLAQNGDVALPTTGTGKDFETLDEYIEYFADQEIKFLGEVEEWKIGFDLSRYIWKRNIVAGIHIPIVYKQHTLKANIEPYTYKEKSNGEDPGWVDFNSMYGSDYSALLNDILNAKGMSEMGGSSGGIGDISLYTHINFESSRFDKMMVGAQCIIPSADKRSTSKLWAPELGNGGHLELALFANVVLYKSKYFNPHVFAMFSGSFKANVDRRVPRRVIVENTGVDAFLNVLDDSIAFGERVKVPKDGKIDVYEAPFREIGDNVLSLKMHQGEKFNVRIGNMVEKFIYRRGFFDLYYDLKVKSRDTFSGFKEDEWNIEPYRVNSQQMAHTVGGEYSYQFDAGTRFRCGVEYVFAGVNVPKALTVKANMNYSF